MKSDISLWKNLLDTWDIRGLIISSLLLQALLVPSGPLRKRTASGFVLFPLWLAYLLADAVAPFAVGLIFKAQQHKQDDLSVHPSDPSYDNGDLFPLWSAFLLLHLGGPDTITAFALEDNQLWLRHLLQLLLQSVTTVYIVILTLPANKLRLPTFLVFLAGLIKYSERTRSLYLASTNRFREGLLFEPHFSPVFTRPMHHYNPCVSQTNIELIGKPTRRILDQDDKDDLSYIEVIKYAHYFFRTFNVLIADIILGFMERVESQYFFLHRTAKDAFKLVEVELNFFYEILYTKAGVIQGLTGYSLRFVSFGSVVVALLLFALEEKKELHPTDIRISYALFTEGISLDIISFFMLILSDWTAVALTKSKDPSRVTRFLGNLLFVKRQSLHPRSEKMEKFIHFFGLTNILDGLKYVNTERFETGLRDFIFEELRLKSETVHDINIVNQISSARGDWVLQVEGCDALLPHVLDVNYVDSLLLWHIATEICYSTDHEEGGHDDNKKNDYCEFAKLLSDYMLYLLFMQPNMIPSVAGIWQIKFRNTCAEAKKFFRRMELRKWREEKKPFLGNKEKKRLDVEHIEACKHILAIKEEDEWSVEIGKNKSVLFQGSILAKELIKLETEERKDKWKIMSKVWVELLSYAAYHGNGSSHVARLSKGGELITLMWLLTAHLSLRE
ncbi:uncharacterized protein LOC127793773 isoform X2 [Diospyros lotus]|uniref:uncharacterized protein LOC127793773 isoform X2 n=1 Tax=Diospyros lotus TaxID=55363 RepID=UPI0022501502|nr:uncharacterized protein LOC127793773 isoform X2 [Diospyros lotus]